MKKIYLLSLILLSCMATSRAQDLTKYSIKFGKVTDYELRMERYDADTSAHAVVIYEDTRIMYNYETNSGFKQERFYEVKIKILDQEGASYGDIAINYYDAGHERKESVSGIVAASYNLEGGKTVKKSLSKKDIHREVVSENNYRVKFSIPDVKAGSVIEFKYMRRSDFITNIPDIKFQRGIPVIYRTAEVAIPEYLYFGLNTKGYQRVKAEKTSKTRSVNLAENNTITYVDEIHRFKMENVPALKNEPYVWCKDDFSTAVEFELRQTRFPGAPFKSFSNTWTNVNEMLGKHPEFSAAMKYNNPYKEESRAIMAGGGDELAKLDAIHKLVMSRIVWNNYWGLLPDNIREAVKTGSGCSSDINFVLQSVIRDAGYTVVPVMLNPRSFGRLPYTGPSLNKINAFILMVTLSDGRKVFLDGTDRNSSINVLPESLIVDRARVYGVNSDQSGWIDLTKIATNRIVVNIAAKVDVDKGLLTGEIIMRRENTPAMSVKNRYKSEKTEDDYIESLEENRKITIGEYEITGLDSSVVTEKYTFTMDLSGAGNQIYIRPTIIAFMDTNPFSLQERNLPIEFSYPYTYRLQTQIELPEGFVVEDMPSNGAYATSDGGLKFSMQSQVSGNTFSSLQIYDRNNIIFPHTAFDNIYTFFGTVANASRNMLVLKKEN